MMHDKHSLSSWIYNKCIVCAFKSCVWFQLLQHMFEFAPMCMKHLGLHTDQYLEVRSNCYIRFHVSRRHCRWCAKTESLQWSPNLMKNEKDCQLYLRGLLYRCCTCSYKCQILHLKHFCWNWHISKILNAYFTISATQHNNSFQYLRRMRNHVVRKTEISSADVHSI